MYRDYLNKSSVALLSLAFGFSSVFGFSSLFVGGELGPKRSSAGGVLAAGCGGASGFAG
jgi:hypothetical protein